MTGHQRRCEKWRRVGAAPAPWLLVVMLLAGGCADAGDDTPSPSGAALEAAFAAYVDGAKACAAPSDCALVQPGCPLGCFVAVRADRKRDVEAKAAEILNAQGQQRCHYKCRPPDAVLCVQNRCTTALEEARSDAGASSGR